MALQSTTASRRGGRRESRFAAITTTTTCAASDHAVPSRRTHEATAATSTHQCVAPVRGRYVMVVMLLLVPDRDVDTGRVSCDRADGHEVLDDA
ncbi:hypothetical protein AWH51_08670 [Clavibacter tessellarius]|uniref:Uncharacterized protein n=1 Tax=Clavibacter tessellarius TaxID=31965 RepID=A0A154V1H6_9MICO|nr:hypothetical protein AWH51_08670 [Clavibacter michiganensis subsp. tessellarius]